MELSRRSLILSGAVGTAVVTACSANDEADGHPRQPLGSGTPSAQRASVPRVNKVLAKDLQVPWGVAFLPNGDALVGERINGNVHRVRRNGGRHRIGQVSGLGSNPGEGGLLGLAVSPTFGKDRWVYAYLSTGSDNRVVRMKYADGKLGRKHLLLAGIPTETNHNGGRLLFAPSGLLFVSTGDALDRDQAQSKKTLNGKILRMTPDGDVPSGNPFGNYVWTYGHRNVETLAFDGRGHLWAAEFGESTRDELNRIRKGRNYGWPTVEGGDGSGPFADPFVTWSPTSTCSPGGLAMAKGRAWVGALAGTCLYSVRLTGPHKRQKHRYFHGDFGRIRTVMHAPDGSLWICTSNRDGRGDPAATDDRVIRLSI
jgi:glucose/arabinose dehydrogenase